MTALRYEPESRSKAVINDNTYAGTCKQIREDGRINQENDDGT